MPSQRVCKFGRPKIVQEAKLNLSLKSSEELKVVGHHAISWQGFKLRGNLPESARLEAMVAKICLSPQTYQSAGRLSFMGWKVSAIWPRYEEVAFGLPPSLP